MKLSVPPSPFLGSIFCMAAAPMMQKPLRMHAVFAATAMELGTLSPTKQSTGLYRLALYQLIVAVKSHSLLPMGRALSFCL